MFLFYLAKMAKISHITAIYRHKKGMAVQITTMQKLSCQPSKGSDKPDAIVGKGYAMFPEQLPDRLFEIFFTTLEFSLNFLGG